MLNPASVNSIKFSLPPQTKVMNERMATKKCCSLHNLYGEWCTEYACGGRGYSLTGVFSLYVLFSQERSQGNLALLSLHKLCVNKHVNKKKFERNSSLEYYYMTCIGKAKHTGLKRSMMQRVFNG